MAGRVKRGFRSWAKGGASKQGPRASSHVKEGEDRVFRSIASTSRCIVQFLGKAVVLDKRQAHANARGTPIYYACPRNRNKYDPRTASRLREIAKAARRGLQQRIAEIRPG